MVVTVERDRDQIGSVGNELRELDEVPVLGDPRVRRARRLHVMDADELTVVCLNEPFPVGRVVQLFDRSGRWVAFGRR